MILALGTNRQVILKKKKGYNLQATEPTLQAQE